MEYRIEAEREEKTLCDCLEISPPDSVECSGGIPGRYFRDEKFNESAWHSGIRPGLMTLDTGDCYWNRMLRNSKAFE